MNRAYTMYRYRLHTVCQLFSSSGKFHRLLCAPAMKCPSVETAGDEVSPRRNGRRRSVPAPKWLAMKCTRDEMAGDEVYPWRNSGDETAATKRQRQNVLLCTVVRFAKVTTPCSLQLSSAWTDLGQQITVPFFEVLRLLTVPFVNYLFLNCTGQVKPARDLTPVTLSLVKLRPPCLQ